jgi:hypothetical protein
VTLGLALLLACGWVWSLNEGDVFRFEMIRNSYSLCSADGMIELYNETSMGDQLKSLGLVVEDPHKYEWERYRSFRARKDSIYAVASHFSRGSLRPHPATVAIPYWLIVTPLTLLSAFLLLRKPRPKKPAPIQPSELDHA